MTPARHRIAWLIAAATAFAVVDHLAFPADDGADADAVVATPSRPRSGATAMAATPRRATASTASAAPVAADVDLGRLERRHHELSERASAADAAGPDPFGAVSWQVAAKAAPVPVPTPAPTAPPFPYAYLGGLTDDGIRTAFFSKGERVLPVKAGDLVDAVYRVEQMSERQMKLTYLPLNQPLVVSLGEGR